jgi:hypothetical protein
MPSLELTRIVEKYEENMPEGRDDPKRRIDACQQMWKLRDPEAILVLKIIYEEDPDPLVQAEAAEVLTNFRRIQREREAERSGRKSKGTGLGWRLLRSILLLIFVGLLILNGLFFWANGREEESDGEDIVIDGNRGITDSSGREEIVVALDQSLTDLNNDALALQNEWQKVEAGNSGDCTITLNRPQPLELSEIQITQYPDIGQVVTDISGDYLFSYSRLQNITGFWDTYCGEATPNNEAYLGNVELLRTDVIIPAANVRANILPSLQAATTAPTIGPSPTNTLPPTETPVPTATLTLEPLANVRYEEHLSALERTLQNNRSALEFIRDKWNPDTRGRPICGIGTLGAAYTLPLDQQGDPDLDEAVLMVESALNDAGAADRLFNENCTNNTLNLDPNLDPTLTGLNLINGALSKFDMAQEKINALRIKVAS